MNVVYSKIILLSFLLMDWSVYGMDQMSGRRHYYVAQSNTTTLVQAMLGRDMLLAKRLIQMGADVHAASEDGGFTPLHLAAFEGDAKIAALLLERGANVNAPDKNGYTPFDIAKRCGNNTEMIRMFRYASLRSKCVVQ